jgi:hypothetical protein
MKKEQGNSEGDSSGGLFWCGEKSVYGGVDIDHGGVSVFLCLSTRLCFFPCSVCVSLHG